jgi:putative ABC transport system permease protein
MIRDVRQALRVVTANPGFSSVVVLTLAVAIGVNTAIFTLVNAVMLRPLPYADPGALVTIWESNREEGLSRVETSGLTFLDWQARASTFASMGAWRYRGFTMTEETAERVVSVEATPGVFRTLGVPAAIGRVFEDSDGRPGGDRRVIMSAGAWARRFGSDPQVLGRTVRLDDESYTIVGVMPEAFQFPAADPTVEFWSPLVLEPGAQPSRPHRMYNVIGRLGDGVSLEQARADLEAVAAGIAAENPDTQAGWSVTLVPAHAQIVGDVASTLWVLFGAVLLVLVIACANVANLVLARSTRSAKDFAVRAAFGAGRFALVRRSLVESSLLAALGGGAGMALAWWGTGVLAAIVPATVPRADRIGVDATVLAFAFGITAGAAIVFGLVPAWRAMRTNVLDVLQEGGRAALGSHRGRRVAHALVILEVALALVLLVGAGLLVQSFSRLTAVDPGFRTSGVTAVHVALPASRYGPAASKRQFFTDVLELLASLPGVRSVGAVSALPMSPLGQDFDLPFTVDGLEATSPAERPRANYRGVMAGYFETMGIALREGRLFTEFDGREDGPEVAVVNETAARRYFRDGSPINRVIRIPMAGDLTIVGVVADVRHYGLDAVPEVEVFVPYDQFPLSEMQVVLEVDDEAGSIAPAFRTLLAGLDPAVPMGRVSSVEELMAASIAEPRFNTALLVALALSAALLAAIGIYGVVTYTVARRTSEIGLRMALGADPWRTFRQVVFEAVRVVTTGVVIGLGGAALFGRSLRGLLYGITPLDPLTFALAGVAIIACGAVAAALPARRASRVDPVTALREE